VINRGNLQIDIAINKVLTLTPILTFNKVFTNLPYQTGYVLSQGWGRIVDTVHSGEIRLQRLSQRGDVKSRGGKV
jgi:hypothetical protein